MRNLEEFIAKDRIEVDNKNMFDSVCKRIDEEQESKLPIVTSIGLKLCCCLIVLVSLFNMFGMKSHDDIQTAQNDNTEYQIFAQENYFDILSDYYPEELVKGE